MFWSLTLREFLLALEAAGEKAEADFEVVKWQTAQTVRATISQFAKNPPTVAAILRSWTPKEEVEEPAPGEKTPMQLAKERFFAELAAKKPNGGTADHSKVSG